MVASWRLPTVADATILPYSTLLYCPPALLDFTLLPREEAPTFAVVQLRLQLRDAEEAMARRQQQQVRKTEEAMVRRLRLLETQVHDGRPNLTVAQP